VPLPSIAPSQRPIGPFTSDPVPWPLCGRITENPPSGWIPAHGCPPTRFAAAFTDLPLSSSFGPRPLVSSGYRYDFHRGIDISCAIGTPVFAIEDGTVVKAGNDPSYSDPVISIRHLREGGTSCASGGCYHVLYLHMRTHSQGGCCAVSVGDTVSKGQLLGFTGESRSGYDHLHFEVRDAPPFDQYSAWQRDAIHPLHVLPYDPSLQEAGSSEVAVQIDGGAAMYASGGIGHAVSVVLSTNRVDVIGVSLTLFDDVGNPLEASQPQHDSYVVNGTSFMFDRDNLAYTHKNSGSFSWPSFGEGGEHECPYYRQHGTRYSAHVHLDQAAAGLPQVGEFNGVRVAAFGTRLTDDGVYSINVTFFAIATKWACVTADVHFARASLAAIVMHVPTGPEVQEPPSTSPMKPAPSTMTSSVVCL